jgi:hypothetical protein
LRLRIHKARDLATARASRSKHGDARLLYWLAAQRAGARVFARVDEDELRETIMELTRLFQTAGSIERRDAPDER